MHPSPSPLSTRVRYILYCTMFALTLIFMRLWYLQIYLMPSLLRQSQKNFLRIEHTASPRGNILDANGIALATNRPLFNLYWKGCGKRRLEESEQHSLATLETILNTSILENEALLLAIKRAQATADQCLIASDVSLEQLSKIEEQLFDEPHIKIVASSKRYYPFQTYACHLLGYLGAIESGLSGKMGLEKTCEDALKGDQGCIMKTINSCGKNLAECELKKALAGENIRTTIDLFVQDILENLFPKNQTGTGIVMDPETGAIIALISRPDFDPSIFLQPLAQQTWDDLQENRPFLNRSCNACYPPGSLFKLVTLSAALEHNVITPDSAWTCHGYMTFKGRDYGCSHTEGHGHLNTIQALAKSCNIPFFEMAKHLDIDLLASYADKFGLGKKTNIIFSSEKEGLVPSRAWKKKTKGERWWPGETLSTVIGQSYLLVTPMQIARMVSSIFTGYLTTPRILLNEPITKESLGLKTQTLAFLRQAMKGAVQEGTAVRLSTLKDISIYAKTSTAQTCDITKRDLGGAYMDHGWVAAYFIYKGHKPLTLVLLAENSGSSRTAVDLARTFLIEYKHRMDAIDNAQALASGKNSTRQLLDDFGITSKKQEEETTTC